jgi:hypothetical protein
VLRDARAGLTCSVTQVAERFLHVDLQVVDLELCALLGIGE